MGEGSVCHLNTMSKTLAPRAEEDPEERWRPFSLEIPPDELSLWSKVITPFQDNRGLQNSGARLGSAMDLYSYSNFRRQCNWYPNGKKEGYSKYQSGDKCQHLVEWNTWTHLSLSVIDRSCKLKINKKQKIWFYGIYLI